MRYDSGGAFFLAVAATLGGLIVVLEASVAASPNINNAEPVSVNRTFKGDRSPALPGASRVVPEHTTSEPELPEGCLAATDWRGHMYSAEIAGRCVV
jgi:hypothetical protein